MNATKLSLISQAGGRLIDISYGGKKSGCSDTGSTSFIGTFFELLLIVFLCHLFHSVFRRFGQPSVISQFLVGIIVGPSILSRFNILDKDKTSITNIASSGPILFMFLVGLETDMAYLRRTFRSATTIVSLSSLPCLVISFVAGPTLFSSSTTATSNFSFTSFLAYFLIIFNTASPVVIRIVHELKITVTPIGRLAISSALINELVALVLLVIFTIVVSTKIRSFIMMMLGFELFILLYVTSKVMKLYVNWVNKRNRYKCEVGEHVVCMVMLVVLGVSYITEVNLLYDPMLGAFVLGMGIPRDGPTIRTMVERLTYAVNLFVMPVYFVAAGLQTDFGMMVHKEVVMTVVTVIALGTVGKVGGTMVAARYLKRPTREGLALGLLLNVKGHVDVIVIALGKQYNVWNEKIHMALLISILINSITTTPAAACVIRRERKSIAYHSIPLQYLSPEHDLRLLVCIHTANELPTLLTLLHLSNVPLHSLRLTPYLLHLLDLPSTTILRSTLYHQLQDKDFESTLGGSQTQHINASIDTFVRFTSINVRRFKAVSHVDTMHEDVQNRAQDVHASLVIVPFHRKQRFDGKMGIGKEEIKEFNVKVSRSAPCTVGILVDRGMGQQVDNDGGVRPRSFKKEKENDMVVNVMVLFLGGGDYREAAAYAGRLALNSNGVRVSVVRFMKMYKRGASVYEAKNSLSIGSSRVLEVEDSTEDEVFMESFRERFVESEIVTYIEKLVEDSADLITTLSTIKEEMYTLYIVGRTVQGPATQLIEGMSDWDECSELGLIGNLLSSSDFMMHGSVLVLQQPEATRSI